MAKVSFTKLGLNKNQEVKHVVWNEQTIEVKQYLPVNEKLMVISRVLNGASDENNFANPVKIDVCMVLEILYAYTNISFTDKQKEDVPKLYDLITSSGFYDIVKEAIPATELDMLEEGVFATADAVYQYRNSAMGVLENVSENYSDMKLDISEMQKDLSDSENLAFLKDVLSKLG